MAAAMVTTVAAAGVAFAVGMIVVGAGGIAHAHQFTGEQRGHSRVSAAADTGVQSDAGLSESSLSTATDAAANEHIRTQHAQKTSQSTVTAAVGGEHAQFSNLPVFHIINLKVFGVAKMLEDLAVVVSNCNTHGIRLQN